MVFVQFLHPNCYNQIHLIPSKLTALQCGVVEGFIIGTLLAIIISIVSVLNSQINKTHSLVAILVGYVLLVGFNGIGYVTRWEKYQQLIKTYREQGMTEVEILNILALEQK